MRYLCKDLVPSIINVSLDCMATFGKLERLEDLLDSLEFTDSEWPDEPVAV